MSRFARGLSALALAVFLGSTGVSRSQDATTIKLGPSGILEISRGEAAVGMVELSAHGAGWTHAPQKEAKAEASDLPDKAGKQFIGTLAVPKTEGGTIRYIQTVKPLSQGVQIDYDLTMSKDMKVSGLQFSLYLPVEAYAGKEVLIPQVRDDPKLVGLPKEQQKGKFQLWSGQGAKIELAKGKPEAVTIELRAATDVVVQDLRQWEQPVFEVRFPAIMQDPGREVKAGERFHLDLTVTFATPVRVEGP
ncbi:MAG: hypothetical protein HN380_18875 [Victivallales bacterium]|nr:hypothetical protein [Victivallales bacterium]